MDSSTERNGSNQTRVRNQLMCPLMFPVCFVVLLYEELANLMGELYCYDIQ